jgi:hypothetical protein
MSFERMIPKSASEFLEYLEKLHQNRKYMVSAKIDDTSSQLRIDLNWMANSGGYPDIYLPLKRSQLPQAKALIDSLLTQSASGYGPSRADAQRLFDMIDPSGR